MLRPTTHRPQKRPWYSLAVSAAVHAGLMVLAVAVSRRAEPGIEQDPSRPAALRETQMVYLPPPLEPEPPPPEPPPPPQPPPPPPSRVEPPRPAAPPPVERQREPQPEANAPPEATRSEGEDSPEPEGGVSPGPVAETAPTMESEARRIFGRPRLATRPGAGPRAVRPMEAYFPEDPAKCVPRPPPPADSALTQFGTVEGRIFRGDDGSPLVGAHLQMIGSPYTAFTDHDGGYRFRFDLALMDQCRTQYVRVTAKGYESRLLVLTVGPGVRSEDVHLKKRSWWR